MKQSKSAAAGPSACEHHKQLGCDPPDSASWPCTLFWGPHNITRIVGLASVVEGVVQHQSTLPTMRSSYLPIYLSPSLSLSLALSLSLSRSLSLYIYIHIYIYIDIDISTHRYTYGLERGPTWLTATAKATKPVLGR